MKMMVLEQFIYTEEVAHFGGTMEFLVRKMFWSIFLSRIELKFLDQNVTRIEIVLFLDSEMKIVPQMKGWNKPVKGFGYSLSQNTLRSKINQKSERSTRFGIGTISDTQSDSVAAIITSHPTVSIQPDSFKTQITAIADNSANPAGLIDMCIFCLDIC